MERRVTINDYPLLEKNPEILFTPDGINVKDVTLENYATGKIDKDDCRTSRSSLLYQAELAKQVGNFHLAKNFERAAEMVEIEGDEIIEIYNALRPFHSSEDDLRNIAAALRERYGAERNAELVEEAAVILKKRKQLKGDR